MGLGVWCVMLLRLFSDVHPAFELATHASFHAFVGCLLLLGGLWILYYLRRHSLLSGDRWRRRLIFVLVPLIFFVWVVSPWRLLPLNSSKKADDSIKILMWNMLLVNQQPDDVFKLIEREKPDVVALIEVNPEVGRKLVQLKDKYPTQLSRADWSAGGIAMISRFPEAEFTSFNPGGYWMPAIEFSLRQEGWSEPLRILSVHTLSPKPTAGERTSVRDKQLASITEWGVKQTNNPAVLVGDFNITPWSPPFWRLLKAAKLKDSSWYFGYLPSFPAKLGRIGIPIDYALYNDHVEILSRRNLYEPHESDHCPVIVEVRVKPAT